jgi:uncharacterized repeat protein (TIGR03803 family)
MAHTLSGRAGEYPSGAARALDNTARVERLERRALLTAVATDLTRFIGDNATHPTGTVTLNAAGDLFGISPNVPWVVNTPDSTTGSAALGVWELPKGAKTAVAVGVLDENGLDPSVTEAEPTVTGGIFADAAGHVYGTFGPSPDGIAAGGADGAIWELTPTGTSDNTSVAVVRATFDGTDGNGPVGTPALDPAGDLFGTTSAGGAHGDGTVWELPAGSGTIRVLASFDATTGAGAAGPVYVDTAGDVFGANPTGGAAGLGTVWQVAAGSGTITLLTDFAGTGIGNPTRLSTDGAADFYGVATTSEKTDTFELTGSTVSVLASVDTSSLPTDSQFTVDRGTLYGTSQSTGPAGVGYVYEVLPGSAGVHPVAYFTDADINSPDGPVVVDAAGDLLGPALNGGSGQGGDNVGYVGYPPDGGVFEVPAKTVVAAVSAAAGQLVFTESPTTATAEIVSPGVPLLMSSGQAKLGTVVVKVEDGAGHVVHDADGTTLTLGSTPVDAPAGGISGPAAAGGTATVVNGVATFKDVVLLGAEGDTDIAGTYTLIASDGIDAPATSAPLTVSNPPPPAPGSISGTVFADTNGNGVRDAGEAGVGGVVINLSVYGASARATTTTTADDGTYSFADVPVGTYTLADVLPAGDTQVLPTGGSYGVTVAAGQAVTGEDFGQAPLSAVVPTGLAVSSLAPLAAFGLSATAAGLDAAGDLFTVAGGNVVELKAGSTAPASVGTFAYGFDPSPSGRLVVNAAGDVFGTDLNNGVWEKPAGTTTVSELADVYSATDLTVDGAGDLFGLGEVTQYTPATVFEYPADGSGLRWLTSSTPGADNPVVAITTGSSGNLFGAQLTGHDGTTGEPTTAHLFEIPAAAAAAAASNAPATPVVLAAFSAADFGQPLGVALDSAGDLIVTTGEFGSHFAVLELPAGTSTVQSRAAVTGDSTLESDPLVDGAGDVFAVALNATAGTGTLLELPAGGTALLPLATLPGGDNIGGIRTDLASDATGNLYGTTTGDANGPSLIYEVTGHLFAGPVTTPTLSPTPTPTTSLTPATSWAITPKAAVAGTNVRGSVRVTLTNNGSTVTAANKASVVRVYATRSGVIDGDSVLVGTVSRRVRLAAGRVVALMVPVRAASLPAGSYRLVAQVTDGAGGVSTASVAPTLAVDAPYVQLSAAVTKVPKAGTKNGESLAFTVTIANAGNAASTGPATLAAYLSADGFAQTYAATRVRGMPKSPTIRAGRSMSFRVTMILPTDAAGMDLFPVVAFTQSGQTATAAATTTVAV